ncbi:hypothetical protein [Dokdonia sp. Hel_I_53]|uniref:hypothetical protein n=1 Tax=Dokdonia sp. Hel_I_53 TaxID=1566287 RepID=UPI00119BB5B7|nr:hypothetical protein [Dokdonia sp. Hel_I_53]TVZ51029.1 hypothetical protein OD90_0165 [Dokdonia sp. Hel_I_53]
MSRTKFHDVLKSELHTLFKKYENHIEDEHLRKIILRGFAYSTVNTHAKLLIMGINPSERVDFLRSDGLSYNYDELERDRYFKKFHNLLKPYDGLVSYCDLFYQKHSEQKEINAFLKNNIGRGFLREQLDITKNIISHTSPRLILLFNRKASLFFTKEWIGYEVESISDGSYFYKSGIEDLYHLKGSNTYIYFSTFIGYRTRKNDLQKLNTEVSKLLLLLKNF